MSRLLLLKVWHQGMTQKQNIRAKLLQNPATAAGTWPSMQRACWQQIIRCDVKDWHQCLLLM
jgi:hypothetical protein